MERKLRAEAKRAIFETAVYFLEREKMQYIEAEVEQITWTLQINNEEELLVMGILASQLKAAACLENISAILDSVAALPEEIMRPYSQKHVTQRGSNRMLASNWTDKYPGEIYRELFRFSKEDFPLLIKSLGIPDVLRLGNGYRTNSFEVVHLLLRKLSTPSRWIDLNMEFDLRPQYLSVIFNELVMMLDEIWRPFIRSLDHEFLEKQYLEIYAAAFQRKGSPLSNVVMTIDGTKNCCARPGHNLQNACYCGHAHSHCLSYQFIELPTGISLVFGPFNGFEHDSTSVKLIQLEEKLSEKLDLSAENGERYCAYLDSGYALGNTFITPHSRRGVLNEEQKRFNREMSRVRQPSEWGIGRTKSLFSLLEFKKNLKILQMPIGCIFLLSVHLKNLHSCLYGSQTAAYFGLPTLSVMEYLGLLGEC